MKIIVDIQYFKRSGKFYTSVQHEMEVKDIGTRAPTVNMHDLCDIIKRDTPGVVDGTNFIIHIDTDYGYPCLIL